MFWASNRKLKADQDRGIKKEKYIKLNACLFEDFSMLTSSMGPVRQMPWHSSTINGRDKSSEDKLCITLYLLQDETCTVLEKLYCASNCCNSTFKFSNNLISEALCHVQTGEHHRSKCLAVKCITSWPSNTQNRPLLLSRKFLVSLPVGVVQLSVYQMSHSNTSGPLTLTHS